MYNAGIKIGIEKRQNLDLISRKIYLAFPTYAFIKKEEVEFEILNAVSEHFQIPFLSVNVAGSSKTGFSYCKSHPFKAGTSDLDIAIIDKDLFTQYNEIVLKLTKGFKDLSSFRRTQDGDSNFSSYKNYITKGIFRPDLMPSSKDRRKWFQFFNKLSKQYIDLFSNINACIYLSEKFFEFKQSDNIDKYKAKNDQI